MLHSHIRLREDRGLPVLGPCLPLPSPQRPPINALYITAVGITSPAASISSNTLTASSILPLLHHQRLPWRSQGRRHCVPASHAEAPLRAAGSCAGARRRLLRPCRIAPAHARTARVLGPYRAAAHASESALLAPGRLPPLGPRSCAHTPTPPTSAAPSPAPCVRAPTEPPCIAGFPPPASLWRRSSSGSPAPEPVPHLLLRAASPFCVPMHLHSPAHTRLLAPPEPASGPRQHLACLRCAAPAAAAAHLGPGPSHCRQPPRPGAARSRATRARAAHRSGRAGPLRLHRAAPLRSCTSLAWSRLLPRTEPALRARAWARLPRQRSRAARPAWAAPPGACRC
jgi:hypothetical protein